MNLPNPDSLTKDYLAAWPFAHIYLDNVFGPADLEAILSEWPTKHFNLTSFWQQKLKCGTPDESKMGPRTREFIHYLNSQEFITWLERLTAIPNLIPDPKLVGGGLHEILPTGRLGIHADFNVHPDTKLDRRINVLVYLNKDWKDEYNGSLELYDQDMDDHIKVPPLFNRMAIFSTTSVSYHGHSAPLACPADRSRKSIAMYYYTNGRPANEKTVSHNTLFKARNRADKINAVKDTIRLIVPPIFRHIYMYVKNRIK